MNQVLTGLDRLRLGEWKKLKGYRLGLLSNQASLDRNFTPARDIIEHLLPGQLKALFGPQHGYGGEDQDNMIETSHGFDKALGIPVFSLYADKREPSDTMLENLDMLVIDLQDVGTRVYTFAATMLHCLKAAARSKKAVLVLDRPNPLGGDILEGPLLEPEFYSFVGPSNVPMSNGLTMGELARVFNHVFHLHCDLEVIPMMGWNRTMFWKDTALHWIMPSPNMPRPETAYVYPGQVIWEGTNLSEGRGTCRPFEIFGAPYLDTGKVLDSLDKKAITGCHLQEYSFRPTFHKWEGELCHGFHLHITDLSLFRPFFLSMALLGAVVGTHQEAFRWKAPPYEYEYHKKPIELILGNDMLWRELEKGKSIARLKERWEKEIRAFSKWRKPFLLYP
ncbi:MAG: DUF1343 domain-containing protein [Deltaproteobacteria bacterium]|nr:DUF1343 domain-containing protein [Deltaproteobacteria bacterium]